MHFHVNVGGVGVVVPFCSCEIRSHVFKHAYIKTSL